MTSEDISDVHVRTEYAITSKVVMSLSDKDLIEKKTVKFDTVQPRKRKIRREKVRTTEEFTVKQTKDAYCRETTRQVGMIASELHTENYELLPRRS